MHAWRLEVGMDLGRTTMASRRVPADQQSRQRQRIGQELQQTERTRSSSRPQTAGADPISQPLCTGPRTAYRTDKLTNALLAKYRCGRERLMSRNLGGRHNSLQCCVISCRAFDGYKVLDQRLQLQQFQDCSVDVLKIRDVKQSRVSF
jgi:hypothetical protein